MTTIQLAIAGTVALTAAVLAGAWVWLWRAKRKQRAVPSWDVFPASEVDTLDFATLVAFFKSEACLAALKANSHIVPVAIRSKSDDGRLEVAACLFDKEKEEVLLEPQLPERYLAKELSADLAEAFGEKDMLVFR